MCVRSAKIWPGIPKSFFSSPLGEGSVFYLLPSSSSLPPPSLIPHPHSPESAHPGNTTPDSGPLNPLYPRTLRFQKDFQKIQKNTFPRSSLKIRISRLRENARIPQRGGRRPPPGGSSAFFKQHSRSIRILSDGLGKVFFLDLL